MITGGNERACALSREYRRAAGLTQRQLADAAGVSIGVVRDLEQGRTARLRARSARAVTGALGLDDRQAREFARMTRGRPEPGHPAARASATGTAPAPGLRLSVLGALTGWRDGVLADLGPPSQKAMLGLLALSPDELLHRETIIDSLWGESPPAAALSQVQRYASRLRRVLDPGRLPRDPAGIIVSTGTGYRLRVTAAQLDLLAFGELAGRAMAARSAGNATAACAIFERALRLWRGDPLSDVDILRRHPAVAGLGRRRAAVTAAYAETACAAGWYERVLPHLQHLARQEPLDEQAHALLILALAGNGQRAAALAVFDELRRRLGQQLGVLPSAELADAHRRVLRGQVPPAAGRPKLTAGVPRLPVPRQLPNTTPYFAGRTAELRALTRLVRRAGPGGPAISVLAGTAGVGKTELVLHWAHQVADRYEDGQLYMDMRGFGPSEGPPVSPAAAVRGLLDGLGIAPGRIPAELDSQAALYRSLLAGRRLLIVLDNVADAAQVRPLLPGTPGCLVLVTSRNELTGLAASDGAQLLSLDALSESEARELLAARLGSVRAAAEPGAVTELTGLCARLPLALSIAAARAAARPGLPLAALAAGLRDSRTRLDELGTGDAATDIRTVFSWSCRHLSRVAGRMFQTLGVHPGPDITVPAAASLVALPHLQTRRALTELARAHLVTEHAGGRYGCHDLLRIYAAELARTQDGGSAHA